MLTNTAKIIYFFINIYFSKKVNYLVNKVNMKTKSNLKIYLHLFVLYFKFITETNILSHVNSLEIL